MATLEVLSGTNAGQSYDLTAEQTVIGRYPFCDIVIPVHTISRQHTRLVRSEGAYFIEDLGSLNGTYVNGNRIQQRMPLADDDRIQLYDVVIVFHKDASHFVPLPPLHGDLGSSRGLNLVPREADDRSRATVLEKLGADGEPRLHVSAEAKLQAVLEITRSLGSSLRLDEVLPRILDSLFAVFPQADRGYILLVGEEGELVPRALKRREDEADTFGPISSTIARQVLSEAQAILSADVDSDDQITLSESVLEMKVRSMMCAPLLGPAQDALGILHIETSNPGRRFTQEDLDVLVTGATVAAQAVANAKAHEVVLRLDRQEREMATAREVQLHFLPERPPSLPGYEFYDFYRAASEVGGDYYGYILLPDGRLAVAVGDVSGKGVTAALLMARLCSETRSCLRDAPSASDAVRRLNEEVLEPILSGRFVTFVLCLIDPIKHELTVVNAGHLAPLVRKAGAREVTEIGNDKKGLPLGFGVKQNYAETRLSLSPGDTIVLCTDGLTEAQAPGGDIYRVRRLREMVAEGPNSAPALGEFLLADVEAFLGDQHETDDMCLVCFQRIQ